MIVELLFLLMVFPIVVSAYVDPGTAGTIFGGTIWLIITWVLTILGVFFSRFLIKPLKKLLQKLFVRKSKK